jgi:hypothetical protein
MEVIRAARRFPARTAVRAAGLGGTTPAFRVPAAAVPGFRAFGDYSDGTHYQERTITIRRLMCGLRAGCQQFVVIWPGCIENA